MVDEKVKQRIRNLLDLSDSSEFDGEITNAINFARKLMLKHGLGEQDVKETPEEVAGKTEYGTSSSHTAAGKLAAWESTLVIAICSLVGSVSVYRGRPTERRTPHGTLIFNGRGGAKKCVPLTFYGPAADARDASELYSEWAETIGALARMKYEGLYQGEGRSYAEGFASELYKKVLKAVDKDKYLTDAQARAALGEGCTALMVRKRLEIQVAQKEEARKWLSKEKGMNLKRGSSRRSGGKHHAGAEAEGRKDGRRSAFNKKTTRRLD